MMRSNQANWDAHTPVHVASDFYGLNGTRSPFDWFAPFEWEDLGDLEALDILHLQCPTRHRNPRVCPSGCAQCHRTRLFRRIRCGGETNRR